MTAGNFLQCLHNELVVIDCHVRLCVDRSKLMLCRGHLVVLCLCRNAKLPEFLVDVLHVRTDALTNRSEIVIVHLLSLRRHCSE